MALGMPSLQPGYLTIVLPCPLILTTQKANQEANKQATEHSPEIHF